MATETHKNRSLREVFIVNGTRTPFLKARGRPGPFSASDLAVNCARSLLLRQPFNPTDLDEVIAGCVMPSPDEVNIGRIIALRLGCGKAVPGWTVQRNCASGLQALDNAVQNIAMGRSNLVLAGGTEAMSHASLLWNLNFMDWLGQWMSAKSFTHRLKILTKLRLRHFIPVVMLKCGLTDSTVGMSMGETAENIAYQFNITRTQMDEFAASSHQRLLHAQEQHYLSEIMPLYDGAGHVYEQDDGGRSDSTLEKLTRLKPFFDRKFGKVTAGNSSQITDGAAFLLLASADAVKKYKLPVLAKITDSEWAGVAPESMGLGPVHAITPMLQRNALNLSDVDYWEINEAFAAQVLGCIAAWEDKEYCKTQLGLNGPFGSLNRDHLNIDGGGISVGHPVGASGARLVLRLCHILKRKNAKRGIASLCIGGGQGGAMMIENVSEV